MTFLSRLEDAVFGKLPVVQLEQRTLDDIPGVTVVPTGQWRSTSSMGTVTPGNAMGIAAVFACVSVISESIGQIPFKLMRKLARGSESADDHTVYERLHDRPNTEMDPIEFRELLTAHTLLWGNGYAEIEMNGRADVLALWPLMPNRMTVKRNDSGAIEYHYDDPRKGLVVLPAWRMFHIRGLSSNGVVGLSRIAVMRRALNLAANLEEFGSAFYDNGASPGGVLEHPGKLSGPAYERLKSSWSERHQGAGNANKFAILEEGMKWSSVGMPMADAQYMETRKFETTEIARMFRVPPHMIQDLERATFSNIEHQSINFVVHTLGPWLTRWEQAVSRCLLGQVERKQLYAKFVVNGLMRGDIKTRYEAYAIGRNNTWLSPNDVRDLEDMNPIPDGDEYNVPLNMGVLGEEPPVPVPAPAPAPAESQAQRGLALLVRDAAERIAARCGDRNEKRHRPWMEDVIRPLVRALIGEEQTDSAYGAVVDGMVVQIARRWFDNPMVDGQMLEATIFEVCGVDVESLKLS